MIKVFTKYDIPYVAIKEPYFSDITPYPSFRESFGEGLIKYRTLRLSSIEEGLEGVKFAHYEVFE